MKKSWLNLPNSSNRPDPSIQGGLEKILLGTKIFVILDHLYVSQAGSSIRGRSILKHYTMVESTWILLVQAYYLNYGASAEAI